MEALKTYYNGYEFRSRLEAKWAVYLDAIGAKYDYEPEGYKLKNGECYLPDFKIYAGKNSGGRTPEVFYLEVKGDPTEKDKRKCLGFAKEAPILVVKNLYKVRNGDWGRDCWLDDDITPDWFNNFSTVDGDEYPCMLGASKNGEIGLYGGDWMYSLGERSMDAEATIHAILKARSARFEFGETPKAFRIGSIIDFSGLARAKGVSWGNLSPDNYTKAGTGVIVDIYKTTYGETALVLLDGWEIRRFPIAKAEECAKYIKVIGKCDIDEVKKKLFKERKEEA